MPIDGGTPLKLNGTLVTNGDVFRVDFSFSPDSSRVVYRADQDTDQINELYVSYDTGSSVQDWDLY